MISDSEFRILIFEFNSEYNNNSFMYYDYLRRENSSRANMLGSYLFVLGTFGSTTRRLLDTEVNVFFNLTKSSEIITNSNSVLETN